MGAGELTGIGDADPVPTPGHLFNLWLDRRLHGHLGRLRKDEAEILRTQPVDRIDGGRRILRKSDHQSFDRLIVRHGARTITSLFRGVQFAAIRIDSP